MSASINESGVKVGDVAPDFTFTYNGKTVHLNDFRGKQAVVLYFYPKDETSVCTAQACSFRDRYEDFKAAGAEIIGVSKDSNESHQSFASHHKLPFTLISDENSALSDLYGVPKEEIQPGLLLGRTTYVIDKQGVVQLVFSSVLESEPHIVQALEILQKQ